MYSKIMVPLDGSELAECVLPHVEAFISQCQVRTIVFIRVIEPTFSMTSGKNPDKLQKEIESRENERKVSSRRTR